MEQVMGKVPTGLLELAEVLQFAVPLTTATVSLFRNPEMTYVKAGFASP